MLLYRLLFYLTYCFFISFSRKDVPEGSAIVLLTIWSCFYLLIPYPIYIHQTGNNFHIPTWVYWAVSFFILLIHLFLFLRDHEYLRIYRYFKTNRTLVEKYGWLVIMLYYLFPVIALIFLASLPKKPF